MYPIQKSEPIPINNNNRSGNFSPEYNYPTPSSGSSSSSFSPVKFWNKDYGRNIQSQSNILKYLRNSRFSPSKGELQGFELGNDLSPPLSEPPLSYRKTQHYKYSNGYRLIFCNLSHEDRKKEIAKRYQILNKNEREKSFFQRRQKNKNEPISDSIRWYYDHYQQTKWEQISNEKLSKRRMQYKSKISSSTSTNKSQECFRFDEKSRQDHVKRYMKQTKISRQAKVWANRDLYLMGLSNEKQNLGNALNITEQFNDDLSCDPNQSIVLSNNQLAGPFDFDGNILKYLAIQTESQMEYIPELRELFNQANSIVKSEFAQKDMCVHLDWSIDEGMTIDMLVKETPSLFSSVNEVIGVYEYVFMKKYLWLEVIAIKKEYQNLGMGRILIERLADMAMTRQKDILLYALEDVVPFYLRMGFEFSSKFPHKPYHDGWFMVKKCY